MINQITNQKIIVVEFRNDSPHLETSLEIAGLLSKNNNVSYFHAGKILSFYPLYNRKRIARILGSSCPVKKAEQITKATFPQIHFISSKDFDSLARRKIFSTHRKSFGSIEELIAWEYDGKNLGTGVYSTLIDLTRDPSPKLSQCIRLVDLLAKTALLSYLFCSKILTSNSYDSIVLFNGRFAAEHAAKMAAQKLNITVYYHERGGTRNRYFFASYMPHQFEKRISEISSVSSRYSQSELAKFGTQFFQGTRNGEAISWHSFVGQQLNENQSLKKLYPNLKSHLKLVTYYSSSDDEYAALDCQVKPFISWESQEKAIPTIQKILNTHGYQLCLRVHPHLIMKSPEEQAKWERVGQLVEQAGGLYVSAGDPINSYSLLNISSFIITGGSTIGVEALAEGLPVIVLTECVYQDLSPSIYQAFDPARFESILATNIQLQHTNARDANKYACWIYCHGHEFIYYEPISLTSGRLLGKNVQEVSYVTRALKYLSNALRHAP